MRTAAIAFVCLLGTSVTAMAGDPTSLLAPQPPPPFPPIPPAPAGSDAKPPADKAPSTNAPPAPAAAASKQDPSLSAAAHPRTETRRPEAPHGRVCFNASETREKIAAHRLADPFRTLRGARFPGEPLRTRLCRWKQDQFVYEISVLRRDGKLVRVYMNAQNGQSVGALDDSGEHK